MRPDVYAYPVAVSQLGEDDSREAQTATSRRQCRRRLLRGSRAVDHGDAAVTF